MTRDLFAGFYITSFDGVLHEHKAPSTIPKPFKQIYIKCANGRMIFPVGHPQKNKADLLGFDASVKVISPLTGTGESTYFYRLICIYKDGSKWSTLFDYQGNPVGGEWL